ncbi:LysR family transcriptional regulator [Streptomyces sp. NPDC006476]|uniref:LysR family transcriptional regulator n=1 Tax=Streptomyces sp. NPDC006476 TaxID=3157175 RepID=UPI0033B26B86
MTTVTANAEGAREVAEGGLPAKRRDLGLLVALDALLQAESVTAAACRMSVSAPAMSRTLHRIREALRDPVLVRTGRRMVLTPRALALRDRVHSLVREAELLLAPEARTSPAEARRSLGIAAGDGYAGALAPRLAAAARAEAAGVTFRFLPQDEPHLVEGRADIGVGEIPRDVPGLTVESLFPDHYVGVARAQHPFADGEVTVGQFQAAEHVTVDGTVDGPVGAAVAARGLRRKVVASVTDRISALLMVADTEAVAVLPAVSVRQAVDALGLRLFTPPVRVAPVAVRMAWHPRHEADPAHLWLRRWLREILAVPACTAAPRATAAPEPEWAAG